MWEGVEVDNILDFMQYMVKLELVAFLWERRHNSDYVKLRRILTFRNMRLLHLNIDPDLEPWREFESPIKDYYGDNVEFMRLQSLSCSLPFVQSSTANTIFPFTPNLKHVDLDDIHSDGADVFEALSHCTNLREISLNFRDANRNIDWDTGWAQPAGLVRLAKCCPLIEAFCLYWSPSG